MTKVLLVDDDKAILSAYARWLGQHCEVVTAPSAEEALAMIEDNVFDIVITDNGMSGRSGLWLLERVQARRRSIGRVLMTGRDPDGIEEYIACGVVQRLLTKPFPNDELLGCVTEAARAKASDPMANDEELQEILSSGSLQTVFQPIFELVDDSYRLYAVEGLVRGPKGTVFESADVLFDCVRRLGREVHADRACLIALMSAAAKLGDVPRLSLNVHAVTLASDPTFDFFVKSLANAAGIDMSRLIFEVVEYAPEWVGDEFVESIQDLRAAGASIAVDDVGSGNSNYRKILDCHPEYIKIDRYFVQGCHEDSSRQAILESIAMLAPRFSSRVIAEGVETRSEMAFVRDIGIDLVQGFLFARPQSVAALMDADYFSGAAQPMPTVDAEVSAVEVPALAIARA